MADVARLQPLPATVAITGPTGTLGRALVPLLEADDRVERIVGVARRSFDPRDDGWLKMDYRQGDVRDLAALEDAFRGADAVVHLAFAIAGTGSRSTLQEINVDGTVNVLRSAAAAGARRLVYASSVAAYGFHDDNPRGMTEAWPTRPAAHLFYAQQKAEAERALRREAAVLHPEVELYLLRPPIVLGPHAVGAKGSLTGAVAALGRGVAELARILPLPLPALAPGVELQFVHEDDVAQALLLCLEGAGPPGAYNVAGEGTLSGADIAREIGLTPLPLPGALLRAGARIGTALPLAPPVLGWAEALDRPPIVDSDKARAKLGWRPRYSSLEALRATIGR